MTAKKKPEPPRKPDPKQVAAKAIGKAASKAKKAPPKAPYTPARKKPGPRVGKSKVAATAEQGIIQPAVDEDAASDPVGEFMGLSIREVRFVDAYLLTHNGQDSYIEAGYTAKSPEVAQVCASQLLRRPKVRAFLASRIKAMIARSEEHQDSLMQQLKMRAFGDVRELVDYRVGACRYCHGKMHRHQYTAGEWDALITKHAEKQEKAEEAGRPAPPAPDPKGGTGYSSGRNPHPDCPECAGLGVGKVVVKDTRYLSPAAVALYAGTKEGKDGIEVKVEDRSKALDTLVKIAKLYEDATNVNVKIDASELDAKYGDIMRASHERMEQMRQEREAERAKRGD